MKPRHDRDWADNVYREGLVAYDLGLWIGALDIVAQLGATLDPALAARCTDAAAKGRKAIEAQVWLEDRQNAADYRADDGFTEDHATLDSLTLLRYSALPEKKALALLRKIEQSLETRHNAEQPYGDWGMMCAYPPFKRTRDIRAKTAFAFRYHNGSDWPYLDGIYAEERLRRGLGGARYALTRWWEMCLANGWAGPVEYFAPPFGRGSLLQGWSSMPATVALHYGEAAIGNAPAVPRQDAA
jgi:glycogen debranching enzyme